MGNNIITVTLTTRTREQLLEQATAQHISLERHASNILAEHVERPDWADVADQMERQALAAEVERVGGQRDRARSLAARLWGELEQKHTPAVLAGSPDLAALFTATADVLQIAVEIIRERLTPPPAPAGTDRAPHPAGTARTGAERSPQLRLVAEESGRG